MEMIFSAREDAKQPASPEPVSNEMERKIQGISQMNQQFTQDIPLSSSDRMGEYLYSLGTTGLMDFNSNRGNTRNDQDIQVPNQQIVYMDSMFQNSMDNQLQNQARPSTGQDESYTQVENDTKVLDLKQKQN